MWEVIWPVSVSTPSLQRLIRARCGRNADSELRRHERPHIARRAADLTAAGEKRSRPSYPAAVKNRVASSIGHLNNAQTAEFLETVGHPELQWVIALHISEQNNSRADVRDALGGKLTRDDQSLYLSEQNTPSEWLEIV